MITIPNVSSALSVCGCSPQALLSRIEAFHGHIAPGLVLGSFMVDLAKELVGPETIADAVVETRKCLPDAVQIFTPCSIGNGWLTVLDWHKFALCLYDKETFAGYRVWLDLEKARRFPNLYNWYMNLVSKKALPLDVLLETIFDAGHAALSYRPVQVTGLVTGHAKKETRICPDCQEAYSVDQGGRCLACQGRGYYAHTLEAV